MTSICPERTAPYSSDIRWRMVWQSEALGLKPTIIAGNLGVDSSTVSRVVDIFRETGAVHKRPYPRDARPNKKLTPPVQLTILHTILQYPDMYLKEIQQEVYILTAVNVSTTSLCLFLKQSNFTRQKMKLVASQRSNQLRQQFTIDVSLYNPEMCIFVDETGSDNRDKLRKYGYSIRGKPPKSCQLLARGKRISVIAAMTYRGIQALKLVRDTVDGDTFLDFIQRDLLPLLMPFNGINQGSIVILDNCTIHHVPQVKSMISEVGALVHYLPPYSPDFNPIEECFSKVKSCLRSTDILYDDPETAVLAAFAQITPQNCEKWIQDSNVYN